MKKAGLKNQLCSPHIKIKWDEKTTVRLHRGYGLFLLGNFAFFRIQFFVLWVLEVFSVQNGIWTVVPFTPSKFIW
jgi:hypothetical protein